MTRAISIGAASALLVLASVLVPAALPGTSYLAAAWADDDDDDGGGGGRAERDDDDDDRGGRGSAGDNDDDDDDDGTGSFRDDDGDDDGPGASRDDDDDDGFAPARAAPAAAPSRPSPPPPPAAAGEIVALELTVEDLAVLLAQGFSVVEERRLSVFGETSRRLRIPPGLSLDEAREAARALPSGRNADANHFYRPQQDAPTACMGPECPPGVLEGWAHGLPREIDCGGTGPIGMIDTGINEIHEVFSGAQLDLTRIGDEALQPSRAIHGTAVAALLVGQRGSRAPGLLPGSRLVAFDAFHRVGRDERTDVFTLVEALDRLAEEGVAVINLSLAGPPNAVLAEVVRRLVAEDDIVLTASVGNAGPAAEPAYPAAYPEVIAVTAVDRDGEVYRRAGTGAHVDIAAPGVEVWSAASVSGARWQTGTSFAVPFVTAAAALLRRARPDLPAQDVGPALKALAQDAGEPGPDAVFGAGLVALDALCLGAS